MVSFKCTEVAKTTIPFDMKEAYARKAHEAGCDPSELLRDQICMLVHKVTFLEYVLNHRRGVLGMQDPQPAQASTRK